MRNTKNHLIQLIIEWQGKEEDKTVDWLTNSGKPNTYGQRWNTNESSGRKHSLVNMLL